jgi:hypothetical protein
LWVAGCQGVSWKQATANAGVPRLAALAQDDERKQATARANAGILPLHYAQGQNDKQKQDDECKQATATARANAGILPLHYAQGQNDKQKQDDERKQATAKANAGVLRLAALAQDDERKQATARANAGSFDCGRDDGS